MNTQLQSFQFQSHPLTALTDEHGEPWFIAKEVAEILEYKDAEAMTRKLDDDEVQNLQIVGFGNRGVNIINESGLWSSVLRSTKPEAKAVKKWLTSEVLPTIRKTGSYGQSAVNPAHHAALQAELLKAKPVFQDVLNLLRLGYSQARAAKMLGIGETSVYRVARRLRDCGFVVCADSARLPAQGGVQ